MNERSFQITSKMSCEHYIMFNIVSVFIGQYLEINRGFSPRQGLSFCISLLEVDSDRWGKSSDGGSGFTHVSAILYICD